MPPCICVYLPYQPHTYGRIPIHSTTTGPISPRSTGRYSALSGSERGNSDSETSTEDWKDAADTPNPDNPWIGSLPRTEAIPWSGVASRPRSPREYSPTGTVPSFAPPLEGIDLITFDRGPCLNNDSWRTTSGHYPSAFETGFSRRATGSAPTPFTYDRETFPFPPSQRAEDFFVRPMPDSPPNPRNPGRFFGLGTSRPLAGAGGGTDPGGAGAMDTGGEGSGAPVPLPAEERIAQMEAQMSAMRTENVQLLEELTQIRAGDKGKGPDRGRPSGPPLRKPRTDHFSLPRPPNYHLPDRGPLGEWATPHPLPIHETHLRKTRQVQRRSRRHRPIPGGLRHVLRTIPAYLRWDTLTHGRLRRVAPRRHRARLVGRPLRSLPIHPRSRRRRRPRSVSIPRLEHLQRSHTRTLPRPRRRRNPREKDGRAEDDGNRRPVLPETGTRGQVSCPPTRYRASRNNGSRGPTRSTLLLYPPDHEPRIRHPGQLRGVEGANPSDVSRAGKRLGLQPSAWHRRQKAAVGSEDRRRRRQNTHKQRLRPLRPQTQYDEPRTDDGKMALGYHHELRKAGRTDGRG